MKKILFTLLLVFLVFGVNKAMAYDYVEFCFVNWEHDPGGGPLSAFTIDCHGGYFPVGEQRYIMIEPFKCKGTYQLTNLSTGKCVASGSFDSREEDEYEIAAAVAHGVECKLFILVTDLYAFRTPEVYAYLKAPIDPSEPSLMCP